MKQLSGNVSHGIQLHNTPIWFHKMIVEYAWKHENNYNWIICHMIWLISKTLFVSLTLYKGHVFLGYLPVATFVVIIFIINLVQTFKILEMTMKTTLYSSISWPTIFLA